MVSSEQTKFSMDVNYGIMVNVSDRYKRVARCARLCFPGNTFPSSCIIYDVPRLSAPTAKNGQNPSSPLPYHNPFVTLATVWCLQQAASCPASSQVVLFIFVLGNNPNWESRSKQRRCQAFIKNSAIRSFLSRSLLVSAFFRFRQYACRWRILLYDSGWWKFVILWDCFLPVTQL